MVFPEQRREQWNEFIAASPCGDVLQCWEWGELKARTGWQPLPIAVERQGELVAACLVLKRTVPLMGGCLLYAPRGPIVDFSDESAWQQLLAELRQIAREHKALACKIEPAIPVQQRDVIRTLQAAGFQRSHRKRELGGVQPCFVMKLDMTPEPEELMARFKSKARYNIRLAARKGVTIVSDCTRDHIAEFHRILQITAQRDGFLVRALSYFCDIWDFIIERDRGRMFLAYVDGEMVAGSIAFVLGHQAWYVYGASSNRHREKMPNHLLQWEMMMWARQRGCRVYDMRGVAREVDGVPQGELAGLNRFKQGFAAQYVEYIGDWDLVFRPTWYKLLANGEPMLKRLRKMGRQMRRQERGND